MEDQDIYYSSPSFKGTMEKWQMLMSILLAITIRWTHILMTHAGENISLTPGGTEPEMGGGSSWEPEREQETSFGGGKTQERRLTESYVDSLYKELSKHYSRTSDATHYDNFRREGERFYFKGRDKPPTNEDGKLKTFGKLKSILRKNRLHELGFGVPSDKLTPHQSVILNKTEGELPSTSDVANADDIELQEFTENVARSTENLIEQLEGKSSEDLPCVNS